MAWRSRNFTYLDKLNSRVAQDSILVPNVGFPNANLESWATSPFISNLTLSSYVSSSDLVIRRSLVLAGHCQIKNEEPQINTDGH